MPLQQAGGAEDTVDAGGATGHHIGIEHHEGQTAVALQGKAVMEVEDGHGGFIPGEPGRGEDDAAVGVAYHVAEQLGVFRVVCPVMAGQEDGDELHEEGRTTRSTGLTPFDVLIASSPSSWR